MIHKFATACTLTLVLFSSFCHAITESDKLELVRQGALARQKAYAPYSKYLVGAAVLTSDGKIFTGCNVENASYGLTCCAERNAIFKAVSEGSHDIIACSVVVKDRASPCGACRQVLNEFNPRMLILYGNGEGEFLGETTLDKLLPDSFGPNNLDK